MNVYRFTSYREILRAKIEANQDTKGYRAKLAQAASCGISFLSQVLHRSIQLTPDQAFALARFWRFDEEESAYFLNLVLAERAGTKELKTFHEEQLKHIREKHLSPAVTSKHLPSVSDKFTFLYYSSPLYQLIHVLLSNRKFRILSKISERLKISEKTTKEILDRLKEMELIVEKNGAYEPTRKQIHLKGESTSATLIQSLWRQRLAQQMLEGTEKNFHYTGIHGVALSEIPLIRAKLTETLQALRERIDPSPDEELVGLFLDFFVVE